MKFTFATLLLLGSAEAQLPWGNTGRLVQLQMSPLQLQHLLRSVNDPKYITWQNTPTPVPDNHDEVHHGAWCSGSIRASPELLLDKDSCYLRCQNENKAGSDWAGYWWKHWGGQPRCGCCSTLSDVDRFWPDANIYRLPPKGHDMLAGKRSCPSNSYVDDIQSPNQDHCQDHCYDKQATNPAIKSYWWKPWGGGHCGCCTTLGPNSGQAWATNWPDTAMYNLPPLPQAPAQQVIQQGVINNQGGEHVISVDRLDNSGNQGVVKIGQTAMDNRGGSSIIDAGHLVNSGNGAVMHIGQQILILQ